MYRKRYLYAADCDVPASTLRGRKQRLAKQQQQQQHQHLENGHRTSVKTERLDSTEGPGPGHRVDASVNSFCSTHLAAEASPSPRRLVGCDGCVALGAEVEDLKRCKDAQWTELNRKVDLILEIVSQIASPPASTVIFGKEVQGGKILLDQGIECSEVAWRTMNMCTEPADWCIALLRGVFGEDECKFYRVYPRYSDCKPFPKVFLDAAKVHYGEFIDRRVSELGKHLETFSEDELSLRQKEFFLANRKQMVNQIGAALADRADSFYKQWKRRLLQQGVQLDPREKRAPEIGKKPTPKKLLTLPRSLEPRKSRAKKEREIEDLAAGSEDLEIFYDEASE